ncbi:MAG: hypothetical protein O3A46_17430, partial [Candidatus Poribacteria bacterium]|nr:hypothetical protein [Candidatus Poribacteria bacterium]
TVALTVWTSVVFAAPTDAVKEVARYLSPDTTLFAAVNVAPFLDEEAFAEFDKDMEKSFGALLNELDLAPNEIADWVYIGLVADLSNPDEATDTNPENLTLLAHLNIPTERLAAFAGLNKEAFNASEHGGVKYWLVVNDSDEDEDAIDEDSDAMDAEAEDDDAMDEEQEDDSEIAFVLLPGNLIGMGEVISVMKIIDRSNGETASLPTDSPLFAGVDSVANEAQMWAVATITDDIREMANSKPMLQPFAALQRLQLDGRKDDETGVHMNLRGFTKTAQEATQLGATLEVYKAMIAQTMGGDGAGEMEVLGTGATGFFDAVTISATDNHVALSATIPPEWLDKATSSVMKRDKGGDMDDDGEYHHEDDMDGDHDDAGDHDGHDAHEKSAKDLKGSK